MPSPLLVEAFLIIVDLQYPLELPMLLTRLDTIPLSLLLILRYLEILLLVLPASHKIISVTSIVHLSLTPPLTPGNTLDLEPTIMPCQKTVERVEMAQNRFLNLVVVFMPLVQMNWVTLRSVTRLLRSTELVTLSSTTKFLSVS